MNASQPCAAPHPQEVLRRIFGAAVDSARPARCLPPFLPAPPPSRTVVIGAGKAAAAMAQAVEAHWPQPLSGLVLTRHGHGLGCRDIEVVEAGHPIPDRKGLEGTARMLKLLDGLTADDLVLCLLSGGGSALLAAPPPGVSLDDEQQLMRGLLRCGATIAEINCVRRHLSLVRGGRLARATAPARLVTLAISDVPGDDPAIIASGPTVSDPTTRMEAAAILARHRLAVPRAISDWLEHPASETPKPGSLAEGDYHLIATPQQAIEAAAAAATELGYTPFILGSAIEGEARDVARVHADIALQARTHGVPVAAPCVLLSGGETTVTVRGDGRGGRNTEFVLALAKALEEAHGIYALAADTDGIDGVESNAGALAVPDTLALARVLGLSPDDYLARNDAFAFFERIGGLVTTGATMTNVNDFRAVLIEGPHRPRGFK